MRRAMGVTCALMLWVGTLATPAHAQNDIGIMNGFIIVGDSLDCTKAGGVNPAGPGLSLIQAKDFDNAVTGGDPAKDRKWRLSAAVLSAVHGAGHIDLCGNMTSLLGVGPRCEWSKGYNGKGLIHFNNGIVVKLDDVSWKVSTVALPLIGKSWDYSFGAKYKPGTFMADVLAQGGPGCVSTNKDEGARIFTVLLGYQILQGMPFDDWNDISDQIDPKNDGPSSLTNPWGDKPKKKPDKQGW